MMWKPIQSSNEAREFIELVGGFHDGCVRELRLATQTWIGPNLSMSCPGHLDTIWKSIPPPENADSIIARIEITVNNGQIEFRAWFVGLPMVSAPGSTAIARSGGEPAIRVAARALNWRDASDWMGEELRYVGSG